MMMPLLLTMSCVFTVCLFLLPEYTLFFFSCFQVRYLLFCAACEGHKARKVLFNCFVA